MTENRTAPVKVQLDALTGARGLAAWFVVFYHVRSAFSGALPDWVMASFAKGYLAVDLFFVLSGFVMWLTYAPKFARDGLAAAPDFLKRRIARIYPLHFVVMLAMIAFALMLEATGRPTLPHYPWTELPLHLLLIQNWGFTQELRWNDPAWSISTELAAYILLPFAAHLLVRRQWSVPFLASGVILLGLTLGALLDWRGAATLGEAIPQNGLLRCLVEFLMGICICGIWQQTHGQRAPVLMAFAVVIALAAAWGMGFLEETYALPTLFAVAVFLLARSSEWAGNPLSSRLAVYVGDISYSTYLVHFFFWVVFKILFVEDPNQVPWPIMALFFAMTMALSAFFYHLVELPGRTWLQALSLKPRPPAVRQDA